MIIFSFISCVVFTIHDALSCCCFLGCMSSVIFLWFILLSLIPSVNNVLNSLWNRKYGTRDSTCVFVHKCMRVVLTTLRNLLLILNSSEKKKGQIHKNSSLFAAGRLKCSWFKYMYIYIKQVYAYMHIFKFLEESATFLWNCILWNCGIKNILGKISVAVKTFFFFVCAVSC